MASFYGGCGEVPPQPSGWQRPDASRFINNAGEGGQVTALAQWCSTSAMGLVSRVTPVQTAKRNCTRDEGGPFEFGNQVLISNHRKLLSPKATVVNVAEASGIGFRHGMVERGERKRTAAEASKAD